MDVTLETKSISQAFQLAPGILGNVVVCRRRGGKCNFACTDVSRPGTSHANFLTK